MSPGRWTRVLLKAGLCLPLLLAAVWAAGFAWFIHSIWLPSRPPPAADGIVALTGGAGRIETALHLLAAGRARVLLVSGVGGQTEFSDLARRAGVDPAIQERVTLGRAAASTHGNALETAGWARRHQLHSLLVVTALYHMPRALTELEHALPDTTLFAVPVLPPGSHGSLPLRLLAGEYTKYLAARSGLSLLAADSTGPSREGG